jgi:MoaA/NifB/PqqE/SkfB family radical SAM enzyme
LELVIRSLGEVNQLGISTIYLSGGEPFLYPELPEVLAVSQQQDFELCVSTNGTLIGSAEAKLLKDSKASVQVSIDGPEAYHNRFRGAKDAFRRACYGIQQLVTAGVPVTVVITLCQDNKECLPWLAEWAAEMGVEHISVQPLLQLGRGSEIHDKKLSEDQLCELFLQLSDLGYAYRSRELHFSLSYRTRSFLLAHPCAAYVCNGTHCHRKVDKEIKKLVIREDGTVLPEIPTLNHRFALGNLHEGTLTELVARYFVNGYAQFHHLCQTSYKEVMPTWMSPIVPWDEIVSERSWTIDA